MAVYRTIVGLGYKFILKYLHKYQLVRTLSVMFFQLGFAFLILVKMNPEKLILLGSKNMWPLNYYFFNEWHLKNMFEGGIGMFMLFWE
jgi:hypothetical protein